jgi:hypothetical protein
MANQIFKYQVLQRLSVLVEDILLDTINFLSTRFNQSKSVFTAASPFGQILIVIENLTQLVFYYIEDSITELNINEATRVTSIYSLASLAGHNPSRAIGASGEISISINQNARDADTDLTIIPNLSRIQCTNNGLTYVLDLPQDEIKFSLSGSDDGIKLAIKQGILESQTVVSRGKAFESFSIGSPQNYFIDNFYVNVYVNGEKWKKYESILDIPRNEKGYITKTGITSGLDIYFGNGNYGKIPNSGSEIIVEYLITEGPRGNIRTSDPSQIKFKFVDTGFSLTGADVDLNKVVTITTTQAPFFGINPESPELTRLIAPKTSKSFALVNPDHYEVVLRRLGLFSLIDVFLSEQDDRILNLFLIPDIQKSFSTSQDYFSSKLDKFILSDHQKSEILKYIEKSGSKLISTDPIIIDPVITRYVINLSVIVFDDVSTEIIKRDIYNAIGKYFIENTRRSRIPKSDLIKSIERINGIDSVAITVIGQNNEIAKSSNSNAAEVGLDPFNDIIISKGELPVIRGGFSDRFGNVYSEGLSDDSLGSVNINIKDITPRPINK